ncbi:MAG: aminodeoxychorismate lyase [Endozoicomonas sp. (ex Botrylloides leachii)]|nr:aminodeoxychorismate lyase [Endozoicomonas sp. (ex Botrylloides leachii)]
MSCNEKVWINGEISTVIAASDRGLSYGDGLFETIRIVAGKLSFEQLHWQRLATGCKYLKIKCDNAQLKNEVSRFLNWTHATEGIIKIIITRGSGGRGYNPAECHAPQRILSLHPLPMYPASLSYEGIAVKLCQLRLGHSALAGIKHLNRLEQVLARSEWTNSRYHEGLLQSVDGWLVEGTMSNIFLIGEHNTLMTPRLERYGVAGVCRQYILNQASHWGFQVKEIDIPLTALFHAKEVFVCNSVNGIWPVVACEQNRWRVGVVTQIIRDNVADKLHA